MASNPISKALADLAKNVRPLIKGYLEQESPVILQSYYDAYLNAQSTPDRKAKSGRRYYSRPNDSSKLRRLYGNVVRAVQVGQPGNIYSLTIAGNNIIMVSGIDTDTKVKAGPDTVTLKYAELHEMGTQRFRKRPFLGPGFEDFNKDALPEILSRFADDLAERYGG